MGIACAFLWAYISFVCVMAMIDVGAGETNALHQSKLGSSSTIIVIENGRFIFCRQIWGKILWNFDWGIDRIIIYITNYYIRATSHEILKNSLKPVDSLFKKHPKYYTSDKKIIFTINAQKVMGEHVSF